MKQSHKILMLGWEFPPKISGGLGVASQGLAEALAKSGHQITFLLPKKNNKQVSKNVKLMDASRIKPDLKYWKKTSVTTKILQEVEIGTKLLPYLPPQTFEIAKEKQVVIKSLEPTEESELLENIKLTGDYEGDIKVELVKYALLSVQTAKKLKPNLTHAHDWITFRAGAMIKKAFNTPLFLHIHSTEYDRNGVHAQRFVIEEEQAGFEVADHIFCVSEKVKQTICSAYDVKPSKITVAPNALNLVPPEKVEKGVPKTLAFIGRLTDQKSPATYIDIARDLHSRGHDFEYLIIGDGYLRSSLEQKVNASNFADRVTFTGFLDRTELLKKLSEIDLMVMPSTSEPFGLVALEAILKKIPVAAASGSGIAEFIPSLPQVERWDQYNFLKLIEKLMKDLSFRDQVIDSCLVEAKKLSWEKTARIVEKRYNKYSL